MSVAEKGLVEVQNWRLGVLLEAGYTFKQAVRIAESGSDLHEAVKILEKVRQKYPDREGRDLAYRIAH